MERILQRLANCVLGFARFFHLDENCRLGRRMAWGEINTAFAGLVFGPNDIRVPSVPPQLPQDA